MQQPGKNSSVGDIHDIEESIHEEARRRAGSADFGSSSYLVGLRVLLGALKPVSEKNWVAIREEIVQALVCRLRTEDAWKRFPNYKDVSIRRPLIITGAPRTGTTALHKLLCVDPQFQGLEHWLCESPMPRPPRDTWESYAGFREAQAHLEERHRISPGIKLGHEVVVDEVDECLELLRQEFVSTRYGCSLPAPQYDRWFRDQDEGPSYRRMADILRLIGLNTDKRWLLKNPSHMDNLGKLFEVFPDALIVVTARDSVAAMSSLCNMMVAWNRRYDDELDLRAIGRRDLDFWSTAVRSAATFRKTRPSQFHDVRHEAFHADPIGTVKAIYRHFNLDFKETAEERMRAWIVANPPPRRLGEHAHSLEEFGLTPAMILQAFETN